MKIITKSYHALVAALLLSLFSYTLNAAAKSYPNETKIPFTADSGETVDAYQGWLWVPENRSEPSSRMIKLEYVRFPMRSQSESAKKSTSASPIVYLAGGPGGSGVRTAKRQRFPLFMAMREFGDVIALDQRGVNNKQLRCTSKQTIDLAQVSTRTQRIEAMRAAIDDCRRVWRAQNIDIRGYTTQESATDLDALRQHLNADKISLWGISYGSHLALASIKTMASRIDKVVLSSVEGLDQTIKYPHQTDLYFQRLQLAINSNKDLKAKYPDIIAMIKGVHTTLEKKPVPLELTKASGKVPLMLQKHTMQSIASSLVADPKNAIMLLSIYQDLAAGNTEVITNILNQFFPIETHIKISGMSMAMDLASGITEARYQEVLKQSKTGLLGDKLNFGLHHFGDIEGLDLGDEFRKDPISDVPTLVLSGTLDGRTYLSSQRLATKGLSNAQHVVVENAGHNLFMSSPAVTDAILTFMRGKKITNERIFIELPAGESH